MQRIVRLGMESLPDAVQTGVALQGAQINFVLPDDTSSPRVIRVHKADHVSDLCVQPAVRVTDKYL